MLIEYMVMSIDIAYLESNLICIRYNSDKYLILMINYILNGTILKKFALLTIS